MALLDGARRVCLFHAHPDDETLATGALIAGLVADGVEVALVTATRGERGEVVDGPLKVLEGTSALVVARERELAGALAELGVATQAFLGIAPARAEGLSARVYRDSGMRWVTPSFAGPSLDAGPDSLTSASVSDAAADLAAFMAWWHPDVLISYDDLGGYGHPDHVACHHIAAAAVRSVRTPTGPRFVQVVSEPRLGSVPGEEFDGSRWLDTVKAALRWHASQLTVDGDDVVHSGGQRQPIVTRITLR